MGTTKEQIQFINDQLEFLKDFEWTTGDAMKRTSPHAR